MHYKDMKEYTIRYNLDYHNKKQIEKHIGIFEFRKALIYIKACSDVSNIEILCQKCKKWYDVRYSLDYCPHRSLVKCKECGIIYNPRSKPKHQHRIYPKPRGKKKVKKKHRQFYD